MELLLMDKTRLEAIIGEFGEVTMDNRWLAYEYCKERLGLKKPIFDMSKSDPLPDFEAYDSAIKQIVTRLGI